MKRCIFIYFAFINILFVNDTKAQDTLIVYNNYKYKVGAKFIFDKSGEPYLYGDAYRVYSGGIQAIVRIKQSKFSVETGLYYFNQASRQLLYQEKWGSRFYFSLPFYYHNISLPISIRLDTKLFYFTIGGNTNYVLSKNLSTEFSPADSVTMMYEDRTKKINAGLIFSLGLEKNINKRFNFFVETRCVGNFGEPRLSNYGFAIGVNYKILEQRKTNNLR